MAWRVFFVSASLTVQLTLPPYDYASPSGHYRSACHTSLLALVPCLPYCSASTVALWAQKMSTPSAPLSRALTAGTLYSRLDTGISARNLLVYMVENRVPAKRNSLPHPSGAQPGHRISLRWNSVLSSRHGYQREGLNRVPSKRNSRPHPPWAQPGHRV